MNAENAENAEWSPTGVMGEAWEKVKGDPVGLVLPVVVVAVIQGIPNAVLGGIATSLEQDGDAALSGIVRFVSWMVGLVLSAFLTGGLMTILFKAARGQPYALSDVFSGGRFFVPMLLTLFLIQVGTGVGFMLCVIPGIILALGWFFAVPILVDQELSPIDALKESWRMTTGIKMDIFVFGLVAFGVSLLGLLACCVGVLPAAAVIALAQVFIYERLRGNTAPAPTVF